MSIFTSAAIGAGIAHNYIGGIKSYHFNANCTEERSKVDEC